MTSKNKLKNYLVSFNEEYWEGVVGRRLKKEEKIMLIDIRAEYNMNDRMHILNKFIKKDGLCIKKLTNMHGSCLYESFKHQQLIHSVSQFRRMLTYSLLLFKDDDTLFPNLGMSMKEYFNLRNDTDNVEFVKDKNTQKIYKYNFDAMCIDIMNDSGWDRVDTEIIMMFMAKLFDLKFIIYEVKKNNTCSKLTVCSSEDNKNTKIIYLGHVKELHYVPLFQYDDEEYKMPIYEDAISTFYDWINELSAEAFLQKPSKIINNFP